jgi:hypothetical protein
VGAADALQPDIWVGSAGDILPDRQAWEKSVWDWAGLANAQAVATYKNQQDYSRLGPSNLLA